MEIRLLYLHMKTLLLVSLFITIGTSPPRVHSPKIIAQNVDTTLVALQRKKNAIDEYLSKHQKEIILLAKVPGKKKLIHVLNGKWPDEVEYSYNILKDKSGHIIFIMESPFSESGDWDIEYHHYFDENGKTYAFSREESIFTNIQGGIIRKLLLKFYDNNFNAINTTEKFMDVKFKTIKIKKEQYDFNDFRYNIYKNLSECLTGYHIEF